MLMDLEAEVNSWELQLFFWKNELVKYSWWQQGDNVQVPKQEYNHSCVSKALPGEKQEW